MLQWTEYNFRRRLQSILDGRRRSPELNRNELQLQFSKVFYLEKHLSQRNVLQPYTHVPLGPDLQQAIMKCHSGRKVMILHGSLLLC